MDQIKSRQQRQGAGSSIYSSLPDERSIMQLFLFDKQSWAVWICALWVGCCLAGCGLTSPPEQPAKQSPGQPVAAPVPSVPSAEPVLLEPPVEKKPVVEPIKPASTKVFVKPASSEVETVTIENRQYPVPPQWQGRKIDFQPFPLSELVPIPPEFTKDGAGIYLKKEAVAALVAMGQEARKENVILQVNSGFRSARYQRVIFKRMMQQGRTFEDIVRFVAPPGYSEHMLGTAVDFAPGNWRFADSPEYRWLRENAAAFGFSETYPEDNPEKIPWESWHWKWSDQVPLPAN